jgi:hypothetical protein
MALPKTQLNEDFEDKPIRPVAFLLILVALFRAVISAVCLAESPHCLPCLIDTTSKEGSKSSGVASTG